MREYRIKVKPNGELEFFPDVPPGLDVETTKHRFSEIVPVNPVKRAAFRALRWAFGEEGRVAEWTREWRCKWECVILRGPAKGKRVRMESRQLLIEWEGEVWKDARFSGARTLCQRNN